MARSDIMTWNTKINAAPHIRTLFWLILRLLTDLSLPPQDLHPVLQIILPDAEHPGVPAWPGLLLHLHLPAGGRDEPEWRLLFVAQHEGDLQGAGQHRPHQD